ncbi:unnamed protein product [Meloidogyne enterolobii]|uniref:Uncharacterized protein n=1 Tax=Meloidogyne enterolobii TaxID=390850 RepID=A0ACB1A6A9_MELEN
MSECAKIWWTMDKWWMLYKTQNALFRAANLISETRQLLIFSCINFCIFLLISFIINNSH